MQNIEIEKAELKNGDFRRVISVGIDYHVVISPDHWKLVDILEDQESVKFKDEQGETWDADFDGENLTFFNVKDKDWVSVKKESLN